MAFHCSCLEKSNWENRLSGLLMKYWQCRIWNSALQSSDHQRCCGTLFFFLPAFYLHKVIRVQILNISSSFKPFLLEAVVHQVMHPKNLAFSQLIPEKNINNTGYKIHLEKKKFCTCLSGLKDTRNILWYGEKHLLMHQFCIMSYKKCI